MSWTRSHHSPCTQISYHHSLACFCCTESLSLLLLTGESFAKYTSANKSGLLTETIQRHHKLQGFCIDLFNYLALYSYPLLSMRLSSLQKSYSTQEQYMQRLDIHTCCQASTNSRYPTQVLPLGKTHPHTCCQAYTHNAYISLHIAYKDWT